MQAPSSSAAPPVSDLPAPFRSALQDISGEESPVPQSSSTELVVQCLQDRASKELRTYLRLVSLRCL